MVKVTGVCACVCVAAERRVSGFHSLTDDGAGRAATGSSEAVMALIIEVL